MPEITEIDPAIASRIDKLTLTSKIPIWSIFPKCFYSKALVTEHPLIARVISANASNGGLSISEKGDFGLTPVLT